MTIIPFTRADVAQRENVPEQIWKFIAVSGTLLRNDGIAFYQFAEDTSYEPKVFTELRSHSGVVLQYMGTRSSAQFLIREHITVIQNKEIVFALQVNIRPPESELECPVIAHGHLISGYSYVNDYSTYPMSPINAANLLLTSGRLLNIVSSPKTYNVADITPYHAQSLVLGMDSKQD